MSRPRPPAPEAGQGSVCRQAFLPVIDGAIKEGLATLEKVEIRFYRSG